MSIEWFDNYLNGNSVDAYEHFGAHFKKNKKGESGMEFVVYAPLAKKINVIGDFNSWSVYDSLMEKIDDRGLYRLFVKGASMYQSYKYHILGCDGEWRNKADPFAFFSELRPASASRTFDYRGFIFHDQEYMSKRDRNFDKPVSIYEMHLGSWMGTKEDGTCYSFEEIADRLIDYIKENGYTHIEIMPITQHPFDGSWGYQVTGYFSVDSRYGNPKQLMSFVDRLHQADIGVILDFVPVHFATDEFGLARFDGSCVYEYTGEHEFSQWGTKNFDLGKDPVRSFLISSMMYFLKYFHFDGLRFDAVSNIIYWDGNSDCGVNQGGVDFIKRATYSIHNEFNDVMVMAEDSSAFGNVTKGLEGNGLGFDYKWDLGWMNDTLKYYEKDPIYKPYHNNLLSFSMAYFYSENFILPLSHDEVVHMKGTILNKMWGDYDTKFALARNLYAYQFAHPGKKLNFMGNELATFDEWSEKRSLSWNLKKYPKHDSVSRMMRDLNLIYRGNRAMYVQEYNPENFRWIMVDNAAQSIFAFKREVEGETMIFIFNMTGNFYNNYQIGVPYPGEYEEVFNSDKAVYSGNDQYNGLPLKSKKVSMHNQPYSIVLKIASFGAIYLKLKK
ncbi:MAG: 1,4-alpha-glucan branching protein GlgB [Bacilli bacterium]